jgi:hypothetical protein
LNVPAHSQASALRQANAPYAAFTRRNGRTNPWHFWMAGGQSNEERVGNAALKLAALTDDHRPNKNMRQNVGLKFFSQNKLLISIS